MKNLCIFTVFLSGFLLAACNYGEVIKPSQEEILARSWANSECPYPRPKPLYCYRTLGDEVCYARPLPDDQEQLLGYYGPKP